MNLDRPTIEKSLKPHVYIDSTLIIAYTTLPWWSWSLAVRHNPSQQEFSSELYSMCRVLLARSPFAPPLEVRYDVPSWDWRCKSREGLPQIFKKKNSRCPHTHIQQTHSLTHTRTHTVSIGRAVRQRLLKFFIPFKSGTDSAPDGCFRELKSRGRADRQMPLREAAGK